MLASLSIQAQSNDYGVTNNHPDKYAQIQISPYGSVVPLTLVNKDFGSLGLAGVGINAEFHQPKLFTIRGDFSYHRVVTNDMNGYKSEDKSLKTFYIGGSYHLLERMKTKQGKSSLQPTMDVVRIFAPRATYGHQGFGEGSYNYFGLGFDFTSIIIGDVDRNTRLDQTKTLYMEAQFGTATVKAPGLPFNESGSTSLSKATKGFQLGFRSTSWFNTGLYIDLAVGYPMLFSGKMGVALNYKKR